MTDPTTHDLIVELREALGLFAGAMACSPKQAWDEAIALVKVRGSAPRLPAGWSVRKCDWLTYFTRPDGLNQAITDHEPPGSLAASMRMLLDSLVERPAAQQSPPAPVCSCPSGDGSLRWPCAAHPPWAFSASVRAPETVSEQVPPNKDKLHLALALFGLAAHADADMLPDGSVALAQEVYEHLAGELGSYDDLLGLAMETIRAALPEAADRTDCAQPAASVAQVAPAAHPVAGQGKAPRAFRTPEPGTPWWQTAKDCGAWTDKNEGDLGYVHFGSVEALRVYTLKIGNQVRAAAPTAAQPHDERTELAMQRLGDLLVKALGAKHEALDDWAYVMFALRAPQAPALVPLTEVAGELLSALDELEKEKSDYMLRNKLGDPGREGTNIAARAAIAKAKAAGITPAGTTPKEQQ